MKTVTATLGALDEQQAARLRGLVLGRLVRAGRPAAAAVLVHLFLLPPEPEDARFAIYETTLPLPVTVLLPDALRHAVDALHAADGDPRHAEAADQRWRTIDPGGQGLYLGSGARFPSPNPDLTGTTIARLVDHTALYLTLAADGRPLIAQSSGPYIISNQVFPADEIAATTEAPFLVIDSVVQCLR